MAGEAANNIVQLWSVDATGGFMYSDELSNTLRTAMQPMMRFRQFCDAEDATEKCEHSGEDFSWDIYSDVVAEGKELDESKEMPETNFTITQGHMVMTERGNSVPYSGKLDSMSKHPVKKIIQKVLKNDANKVMEKGAHSQFDSTLLVVGPAAGNSATDIELSVTGAAGLAAAQNAHALTADHVKKIVDAMKEREIPAYDGTNYMCVGRPSSFRQFKDDLEAKHSYVDMGFGMILNGEVGRSYEGVRFFEQTAIAAEGWAGAVSDACFFFGEDTVAEGIVIPEEMRGKIPGDYGRSKGVAWYAINGFAIVHNQTGAEQNRIVKWGSKA